jgi:RNA polymerase sigma-70 factor (ECF subfamily)
MVSVAPGRVVNEAETLLVERCVAGDAGAQRALYDRHARTVMRTARRLGLPASEVEDVAQEVFTIAFREMARVQPGALSAWLFRLVSNRVNDRHRRRRVRETFAQLFGRFAEPETESDPERDVVRKEAEERVAHILSRMSQKKREVFVLFELEDVPGTEIAEKLGIPVDTVWTRLHHARRDFAKIGRSLAVIDDARRPGGLR